MMHMPRAKYTQNPKTGYWSTKAWDGTFNPDGTKHRVNLRSSKSSRDLERMVAALALTLFNCCTGATAVYFNMSSE